MRAKRFQRQPQEPPSDPEKRVAFFAGRLVYNRKKVKEKNPNVAKHFVHYTDEEKKNAGIPPEEWNQYIGGDPRFAKKKTHFDPTERYKFLLARLNNNRSGANKKRAKDSLPKLTGPWTDKDKKIANIPRNKWNQYNGRDNITVVMAECEQCGKQRPVPKTWTKDGIFFKPQNTQRGYKQITCRSAICKGNGKSLHSQWKTVA